MFSRSLFYQLEGNICQLVVDHDKLRGKVIIIIMILTFFTRELASSAGLISKIHPHLNRDFSILAINNVNHNVQCKLHSTM